MSILRFTSVVAAALALSSCQKAADEAEPSNSSARGQPALATQFVDPGTALAIAGAGLDVAIKLRTLFGSNDSNSQKRLLNEIKAQNAEIISRLGKILDILNNMGVIVQRSVREELHTHIRTTIGSNFQLFYETWAAELDDPRSRGVAFQRYERDILPAIRPLARQLANGEVYGYAHFETVGHAMMIETQIARRLREPTSFRKQSGIFYQNYFATVLNPAVAASLGAQIRDLETKKGQMDVILAAADSDVARRRTWTRTEVISSNQCRGGRKTTTEDVTRRVEGDRNGGYRVVEVSRTNRRTEDDCDHECTRCFHMRSERTVPVDTGDQSAAGRAAYWTAVAKVLRDLTADLTVLRKTAETAEVYRLEAQKLATSG